LPTGSWDVKARIWDAATGELLHTLQGHTWAVSSTEWSPDGTGSDQIRIARWSPDGARLAMGTDTSIEVRDPGMGLAAQSVPHPHALTDLVWNASGEWLAGWNQCYGGAVQLRNPSLGTHHLLVQERPVTRADFSPDGARIATIGSDERVRVWDVGTGKLLRALEGHMKKRPGSFGLSDVRWSPSGRWLLSRSYDTEVIVWDPD